MRKIDSALLVLGLESEHILLLRAVQRVELPSRSLSQSGHRIFWVFQQDKTGNRTVTGWPENVRWVNGTEPQLALGSDQITILMAVTVDGGDNWIIEAQSVGQALGGGGGSAGAVGAQNELQLNNSGSLGPANVFRNGSRVEIRQGMTSQRLLVFGTTDVSGLNYECVDLHIVQGVGGKYVKLGVDRAGTGSSAIGLWLAGSATAAITFQLPDGTILGGNARGVGSVDFQVVRNNSARVASGSYCLLASSQSSTVGGSYSTSLSSIFGNITGNYCFAGASRGHQLQGERSASISSNVATIWAVGGTSVGSTSSTINSSAAYSSVISSDTATISGQHSVALATYQASLNGSYNVQVGYNTIATEVVNNNVILIGNQATIPVGYSQFDSDPVGYYISLADGPILASTIANTVDNRSGAIPVNRVGGWGSYTVDLLISYVNSNDSTYVKSRLQSTFNVDSPSAAATIAPLTVTPIGLPPISVDLVVFMFSGVPCMYLRSTVNPGMFPPSGDPEEGAYYISVTGSISFTFQNLF